MSGMLPFFYAFKVHISHFSNIRTRIPPLSVLKDKICKLLFLILEGEKVEGGINEKSLTKRTFG